jgi:hypothetical protein
VPQIAADVGISEATCRRIIKREGIALPADRVLRGSRRHDANRIVDTMVMDAEHLTADVGLIDFSALDSSKLSGWIDAFRQAQASHQAFIARLEQERGTRAASEMPGGRTKVREPVDQASDHSDPTADLMAPRSPRFGNDGVEDASQPCWLWFPMMRPSSDDEVFAGTTASESSLLGWLLLDRSRVSALMQELTDRTPSDLDLLSTATRVVESLLSLEVDLAVAGDDYTADERDKALFSRLAQLDQVDRVLCSNVFRWRFLGWIATGDKRKLRRLGQMLNRAAQWPRGRPRKDESSETPREVQREYDLVRAHIQRMRRDYGPPSVEVREAIARLVASHHPDLRDRERAALVERYCGLHNGSPRYSPARIAFELVARPFGVSRAQLKPPARRPPPRRPFSPTKKAN